VPGYLYTERRADASMLEQELEAMRAAGVPAARTDDIPLPFPTARGLRVEAQAQLHPRRYLVPLARALQGDRVRIFEMTKVIGVRDGEPCRVETEAACVTARDVIVTANVPINNRVLVHTKLAAYRSYAVAASLPRTAAPRGLFWDTDEPYHYIRTQRVAGSTMVIVGGEDHKVGEEEDTDQRYQSLQAYLRSRFGSVSVRYHWSGQIIEPVDGLPFIGRNPFSAHVYVATGFSGNGMTFGTLAGMLLSDLVLGRTNPFTDLYDARRVKPIVAAKAYLTENIGFPRRLVADRLTNLDVEASSVDEVGRGEGALPTVGGTKYAIYRDPHGRVHALSPICTHLACDVRWNTAERSWDCPCHGSRFTAEGKVLNGPAVGDLAQTPLPRSVTLRRRAARSRGHIRQGRAGKQARQRRRS
jgi:glycine/D-amino acid oxidase-like deaminating enzyme/nitrite reductase/ring-hydroxylating ferredoxin subunit